MKKIISFGTLIILMLITLTGCVSIDYGLTINEDGSGDVSYVFGLDKEAIQSLGTSAEEMSKGMKEQTEADGYTVETYEDDKMTGFKASKKMNNVAEEFSLEKVFGADYIKDTEENKIKIEKGIFNTKYSQKASLDLTSLQQMSLAGMTLKYSITLPTKVGQNNADEVSEDGKTLTWNLEAGSVNEIEFTSSKMSVVGTIAIVGAIIVVAVILAVIVMVISKKVKKGKAVNNSSMEPEEVLEPETQNEETAKVKEEPKAPEVKETEDETKEQKEE